MASRHPLSSRLSDKISNLYDFSLPYIPNRRALSIRRERTRYSQLYSPIARPSNLSEQNSEFNYNDNGQQSMNPSPELSRSSASRSYLQADDEDSSDSSLEDSMSYSESDDDDNSSVLSLEWDENHATEDHDIKINIADIGVDEDNEKIDLTASYLYHDTDTIYFFNKSADYMRVFVGINYVASRHMSAQNKLLVNKLIKYARYYKLPVIEDLLCVKCMKVPKDPVTGPCGHTRCLKCIRRQGTCPCGTAKPHQLHVNILVKHIIEKMIQHYNLSNTAVLMRDLSAYYEYARNSEKITAVNLPHIFGPSHRSEPRYLTLTMEARFAMARKLAAYGEHINAIPHLAHVAASKGNKSKHARTLLNTCITAISGELEEDRYCVRKLYRSVRNLSASSWLTMTDVECVLCVDPYKDPITTYCGHTYCRNCLLRSINYSKNCPLCKRSLVGFNVHDVNETLFVASILFSIEPEKDPVALDPDMVPIFMCAVALPSSHFVDFMIDLGPRVFSQQITLFEEYILNFDSVPCPLLIIDARYWHSLRRLLGNDNHEFGMIPRHKNNAIPEYGTILEIRDCIQLPNGSVLLSTVGKWRFRITQTVYIRGCDVARVKRLSDSIPQDPAKIHYLQILAASVAAKANRWLSEMDTRIHMEIESVYGKMPVIGNDESNWWESDDGPNWLWWLISILPLKLPIKILIFSAQCLIKRLNAVDVTLNTIELLNKMKTQKTKRTYSNLKYNTRPQMGQTPRDL